MLFLARCLSLGVLLLGEEEGITIGSLVAAAVGFPFFPSFFTQFPVSLPYLLFSLLLSQARAVGSEPEPEPSPDLIPR